MNSLTVNWADVFFKQTTSYFEHAETQNPGKGQFKPYSCIKKLNKGTQTYRKILVCKDQLQTILDQRQ